MSPGNDSAYIVCASIINRMKGAMTDPEFRDAVRAIAAADRGDDSTDVDALRERIKTSLTPDELREMVLGLDTAFQGGDFPQQLLLELDPARSGRRAP